MKQKFRKLTFVTIKNKGMKTMIPLYKVPNNSKIDVSHLDLQREDTGEKITTLDFHHIDGMYSLCYLGEEPIHLMATTMVNVINDKS